MKINTDFIDSLIFVLIENNLKEFFIVCDTKLEKLVPYIPTEDTKVDSLAFQAVSIHLRDKNKHYIIHSSEFPAHLFNKNEFVSYVLNQAISKSKETYEETGQEILNLNKFFNILETKLKLSKDQINRLYYELELRNCDDNYNDFDEGYLKFKNDIFNSILNSGVEEELKLAMIEHLKENKELIKKTIDERLDKILSLLDKNKPKQKVGVHL